MKTALCIAILAISSFAFGQGVIELPPEPSNAELQSIIAQQQQNLDKITKVLQTATEILQQQDDEINGLRIDFKALYDEYQEFKTYFYNEDAALSEQMRQIEDWHKKEPVPEKEPEPQ